METILDAWFFHKPALHRLGASLNQDYNFFQAWWAHLLRRSLKRCSMRSVASVSMEKFYDSTELDSWISRKVEAVRGGNKSKAPAAHHRRDIAPAEKTL